MILYYELFNDEKGVGFIWSHHWMYLPGTWTAASFGHKNEEACSQCGVTAVQEAVLQPIYKPFAMSAKDGEQYLRMMWTEETLIAVESVALKIQLNSVLNWKWTKLSLTPSCFPVHSQTAVFFYSFCVWCKCRSAVHEVAQLPSPDLHLVQFVDL